MNDKIMKQVSENEDSAIKLLHENVELKERISKAIHYIEKNNLWTSKEANGWSYMKNECNELLEILRGEK